ncbi:MAG: hypothetical protein A2X94_08020 [Bdellovibrionales bacterium GWB1_55_8]|nr:MAG: hypothetical protein A2X94_08020 [Bdellovibrionales bacterium GWB1_55_8]
MSDTDKTKKTEQKDYYFGGIKEFNLEQIETEVLNESIYLDVFAGSDLRLKKNVLPIEDALSKVLQIEGVRFEWNPEAPGAPKNGTPQAGLIAQDVAAVMPELVRADRDTGMLAVEYSKLVSYLVEAVKDLNAIVLKQEARIRALEKPDSRH